jgi:hypothetical protein
MKNNFNIDRYLDEAEERFSGFNGEDYDDYMYEDDVYMGADGDYEEDDWSMATGGGVDMLKSPSPYQITVQNTTGGTLTLILFGKNQYLLSPNFGSAIGLIVTPSQANVTYLELLQQSADQPFETSLLRVQSDNDAQITQILTVTVKDANGQSATLPVITQSYFSSYQQQSGILDVPYNLKIDGNSSIATPILGGATVTYTFFPAEKVNVSKGLAGKKPVQVYGNPQVNLGGMTFPKRPVSLGGRVRRRIGSQLRRR